MISYSEFTKNCIFPKCREMAPRKKMSTHSRLFYTVINTRTNLYEHAEHSHLLAHAHAFFSSSSFPNFVLQTARGDRAPSHLRRRRPSFPLGRRPCARSALAAAGPSRQRPGSKASRRPIFICCLHCCLCHKSSAFWSVAS